ncbi:MAG: RDD family protein [Eubacteriales bacterium]|nr:RDD family protein [Eubacteriales bacterium]
MAEKRIMKLATRGKRFAAGLIDWVPLMLVNLALIGWGISLIASGISSLMSSYTMSDGYYSEPYVHGSGSIFSFTYFVLLLIYVGAEIYFMTRSQTIGKAILGLQVVDAKTGRPIGFAKMLLREIIVKKASSAIFYLGYIWILIDKYNRSWHDKILDTYVIDRRPEKTHVEYVATGTTTPQAEPVKPESSENPANPENPVHEVQADVPIHPFEDTKSEDAASLETSEYSEAEESFEVVNTEEREVPSVDAVELESSETLNPRAQLLRNLEKDSDVESDVE